MVSISVKYTGDLHCDAVHGPSNAKIATDAPTDNKGKGEAFSPTDLVATALAPSEVHVPLPKDHPQRELLEQTALNCPVHKSLPVEINRPIKFFWEG